MLHFWYLDALFGSLVCDSNRAENEKKSQGMGMELCSLGDGRGKRVSSSCRLVD